MSDISASIAANSGPTRISRARMQKIESHISKHQRITINGICAALNLSKPIVSYLIKILLANGRVRPTAGRDVSGNGRASVPWVTGDYQMQFARRRPICRRDPLVAALFGEVAA